MAVIKGTALASVFDQRDSDKLALAGATGVHTQSVGSHTFVYAASQFENGVSAFELKSDGSLKSVQTITDSNAIALGGASNFASARIGGVTYLFVDGAADNGVTMFRVGEDGKLSPADSVYDTGALALKNAAGRMSVVKSGSDYFLNVAGYDDSGVTTFKIDASGNLIASSTNLDFQSANYLLSGPVDTASAVVGGNSFVFIAGFDDSGITSFKVNADGTTSYAANFAFQASAGPSGLATAKVAGHTYLFASTFNEGRIGVFDVGADGKMTNVFTLQDDAERGLANVSGLTAFEFEGRTYLAASGSGENALGYYRVSDGGVLSHVDTFVDNAETFLGQNLSNAFANVGGNGFLVGTAASEGGLTVLGIGAGRDKLKGTDKADTISGLGGADTLDGRGGGDVLIGGAKGDKLIGGSGSDTASYAGASKGVTASLAKPGSNTNDAKGDTYSSIENLKGSSHADRLTGNSHKNILDGGNGNDSLHGGGAVDRLTGGKGDDRFYFDTSLKSAGVDTITDFSNANGEDDSFRLDGSIFKGLGTKVTEGELLTVYSGHKAKDGSDHLIYNAKDASLWYDADGSGKGEAIHFATLTSKPALTPDDFSIF